MFRRMFKHISNKENKTFGINLLLLKSISYSQVIGFNSFLIHCVSSIFMLYYCHAWIVSNAAMREATPGRSGCSFILLRTPTMAKEKKQTQL
jgi:hypothetical protein